MGWEDKQCIHKFSWENYRKTSSRKTENKKEDLS
jgi:hypothetical protein